jgi:glycine hydroxymethyltransferase
MTQMTASEHSLPHQAPDPVIAVSHYMKELLAGENRRRNRSLTLIASEWAMDCSIREALSSVFAEKYFEGTPSNDSLARLMAEGLIRRDLVKLKKTGWYAPGCELYDDLSWLAQAGVLELYDPYNQVDYYVDNRVLSGSQANQAVALTVMKSLKKKELTIMCLDLDDGGHLSHGHKANIAGILHNIVPYRLHPETEQIDLTYVTKQVASVKPDLFIYGGSACPRDWDHTAMMALSEHSPHTVFLFDGSHPAGLIAAGLNSNPFSAGVHFITMTTNKTLCGPRGAFVACLPRWAEILARSVFPGLTAGPHGHEMYAKLVAYTNARSATFADLMNRVQSNSRIIAAELREHHSLKLVTNGTDTHMTLIDLRGHGGSDPLTGMQVEIWAEECGIYLNRNTIPYDPLPNQNQTSGLRVGVGVASQRGMGGEAMRYLASMISTLIRDGHNPSVRTKVGRTARDLIEAYPFPAAYG